MLSDSLCQRAHADLVFGVCPWCQRRVTYGQTVKDYVVVIFPDDEKLWGGQSRFVRAARPNQDGAFDVKGLPPAKYLAVAVDSLETGAQSDPEVLGRLKPRAKSFTLADGRSQTLTLDMVNSP